MFRLLSVRPWLANSFRGRIGVYDCLRTKKKGRMARKMAKLAKLRESKPNPFAGLGKISASTRESFEMNLELASLAKTNMTNLEAVQARIDRRAARLARKAERKRKNSKLTVDAASIRAEREKKRALEAGPLMHYPDDKEAQEFIIKRFLRLQHVDLSELFKNPNVSVFNFENIKQPYFLSVPHESQVESIRNQIMNIVSLAEQCHNQQTAKKSLVDELVYLDSYDGDVESNSWWQSLACPFDLQYECYNDWILDVYLKYGLIKDPFINQKGFEERIISDYNNKLVEKALTDGVIDIKEMVNYDIMDVIKEVSSNDPSNKSYIWTIYGDYFLQVHKKLIDGNPGHSRESLEYPPEQLHPNVEFILRSARTVWDGNKWILPNISDDSVNLYEKYYKKNGYEWPSLHGKHTLPINEEIHHPSFNYRVWRKIIAHDPERLQNYRDYLKTVFEHAVVPRRKMTKLFKRVIMRVAGSFASSFSSGTLNDALYFYKNSPKVKNLVINSMRKECMKYPDVFRQYIMRKVRSSNYTTSPKDLKKTKKQVRERDYPLDDFFIHQMKSDNSVKQQ